MTATPDQPAAEAPAPLLLDIPLEDTPVDPDTLPTARQRIAAWLEADHDIITAYPYVMVPENVAKGKPVCSVYRKTLAKGAQANVLRHDVTIDIFVALTDGAGAESEAEDALTRCC